MEGTKTAPASSGPLQGSSLRNNGNDVRAGSNPLDFSVR